MRLKYLLCTLCIAAPLLHANVFSDIGHEAKKDGEKVGKEAKPASKKAGKEIKSGSKKAWSDIKHSFHKK